MLCDLFDQYASRWVGTLIEMVISLVILRCSFPVALHLAERPRRRTLSPCPPGRPWARVGLPKLVNQGPGPSTGSFLRVSLRRPLNHLVGARPPASTPSPAPSEAGGFDSAP